MLGWLQRAGWQITIDPEKAAVIVINTCSFIEDAADESIDAILTLSTYKSKGQCKRLIVTGCLPERYREEIVDALPEVDIFLGTGAFDRIIDAAEGRLDASGCYLPDPDQIRLTSILPSRKPAPAVYLKIAEGCNRHCTYCIIPQLRGKQKSRCIEDIIEEARILLTNGVKELTLVSQETTAYGNDRPEGYGLSALLHQLALLPEAQNAWIRFLYGHPESIDVEVMKAVANHPNLCPYFDIPIQHASSRILKLMGRRYSKEDLFTLFERIRNIVPQAVLRTTVIVGFPGETEEDVKTLLQFIQEIKFDHLGVFTYSDAEDLPSHRLPGPVNKKHAQHRKKRLMQLQQKISAKNNQKYLGRSLTVLVESCQEENLFLGRCIFQASEVDGLVYLHTPQDPTGIQVGKFCTTRITDTLEYDLIGEVA